MHHAGGRGILEFVDHRNDPAPDLGSGQIPGIRHRVRFQSGMNRRLVTVPINQIQCLALYVGIVDHGGSVLPGRGGVQRASTQ